MVCAQEGTTSLMMASEKGHLGVVQVLLDAGANKEAKDGVGGGGHGNVTIGGEGSLIVRIKLLLIGPLCAGRQDCSHAGQPEWTHLGDPGARGNLRGPRLSVG